VSADDVEAPRTGSGSFCCREASLEVMRSANVDGDSGSGVTSADTSVRRKLSSVAWLVGAPDRA